jgi:hypothetical protein
MYHPEERKELIEKGLCTLCGIEKAQPGKRMCQGCGEYVSQYNRERRKQRLSQGTCLRCSKPRLPNHNLCADCIKIAAQESHKHREEAKEHNLCPYCLRPSRKQALPGIRREDEIPVLCEECAAKARQKYHEVYKPLKKAKKENSYD